MVLKIEEGKKTEWTLVITRPGEEQKLFEMKSGDEVFLIKNISDRKRIYPVEIELPVE